MGQGQKVSENIYFNSDGVQVTESRLVIGGQTFALGNISSVTVDEHGRNLIGPLFFGLVGIGCLAGGSDWSVLYPVGLASLALAAFIWRRNKKSWHLIVETGATRFDAYQSADNAAVFAARDAITDAMVRRG